MENKKPGKEPIKAYEYNPKGGFIRSYESLSEAYKVNKVNKTTLENVHEDIRYAILPNGNFLSNKRVYRDDVKFIIFSHNNPYNKPILSKVRPVGVYNLKGELLLEARNPSVLFKLLKNIITRQAIERQLKLNKDIGHNSRTGLIFRYL